MKTVIIPNEALVVAKLMRKYNFCTSTDKLLKLAEEVKVNGTQKLENKLKGKRALLDAVNGGKE